MAIFAQVGARLEKGHFVEIPMFLNSAHKLRYWFPRFVRESTNACVSQQTLVWSTSANMAVFLSMFVILVMECHLSYTVCVSSPRSAFFTDPSFYMPAFCCSFPQLTPTGKPGGNIVLPPFLHPPRESIILPSLFSLSTPLHPLLLTHKTLSRFHSLMRRQSARHSLSTFSLRAG